MVSFEEPISGNSMNVALSCIIFLSVSFLLISIQSIFLGKHFTCLDATVNFYKFIKI